MNLEMLDETKVLRDPIHGYIRIKEKVIWDLLNSKEFQRLRRIHQLGADNQVYHTAEHSRFSHSLGVYEIVRRMIEENDDINKSLTEYEKLSVKVAALLHDVGHGPFSHAFEHFSIAKHEEYTNQIITGDSEIFEILSKVDFNLPLDVASIIKHDCANPLLSQMISSQLDADRMDYLLRDAYFTGTSYGKFDLERVLRTIRVSQGKLVVKESGIHTIEDYIMARYHMYWQVYLHPISRSFEAIMTNLFKRMEYLYDLNSETIEAFPMFLPIVEKNMLTNDELYKLDDGTFQYGFLKIIDESNDMIMKDLADRLINRRLFGYESISNEEKVDDYRKWIIDSGFDPEYYMFVDKNANQPYSPYLSEDNSIWVLMNDGDVKELSETSSIVAGIMNTNQDDYKVYFPKELNL